MDNTLSEKIQFFDVVIIDLPVDLRETHYYQLLKSSISIEEGIFDDFPRLILSMVQEPILNISMFYEDLVYQRESGGLTIYASQLDHPDFTENELFKLIGQEITSIVEHISNIFKDCEEDLQIYNHADFINRGVIFIHARDASEVDRVAFK